MLSMEELSTEHYKNLQKQLERKYGFIYPIEDKKSFFIGVADYVDLVEHSDVLRGIVIHFILDKRNELDKKIADKTERVVKEVKETYKKVLEIIEKNKIEDDRVKYSISEYEGYLNGRIQISGYGNFGTYLSDKVRDIILTLEEVAGKEIIDHFGIYDHNKLRVGWKISASEPELEELISQRREEKDLSIWGAWEDLWWVYDVVFNKNERWKEIRAKEHNTMESVNYSLWVGKVKNALDDAKTRIDTSPLNMTEYKRHLFRVNDKLQTILDDVITASEKQTSKDTESKFEYDHEGAMLHYDGNLVFSLHRGKGKAKIFKALWDGKRVILNGFAIEKGKPAILRKDLKSLAGSQSTNSDGIDKAISYFRKKLRGFPVDIIAEKGFRLVLKG